MFVVGAEVGDGVRAVGLGHGAAAGVTDDAGRRPRARRADVTFRLGTEDDALGASRIIDAALSDLNVRQGRAPFAGSHDDAAPVLRHLTRTDGDRFWIARAAGAPVAVGAAFVRGPLSFLAALFVLPEWQGKGVGRALLERALEGQPPPGGVSGADVERRQSALERAATRATASTRSAPC